MAKRKLKKKVKKLIIKITIMLLIIIILLIIHKNYKYKQTNEYKLINNNYTKEETKIILKKLNNKNIDLIITKEHIPYLTKLINEKYYLNKNLERYISYQNKNKDNNLSETIAIVNVNRDYNFYENTKNTNISDYNSMLVNKYNLLNKEFIANDIIKTSSTYSYSNNNLNKEAYEAFKKLANDAKKEGYTILILSSYRNYEYQEKLWNKNKNDDYVARPGASEHETGLAIDVADFYDQNDSFKDTESYKWMINNSYKYGFILRYPEGKENITGYKYEAWHYRYLGIDLATKVYKEGITYDEYYAYYIDN